MASVKTGAGRARACAGHEMGPRAGKARGWERLNAETRRRGDAGLLPSSLRPLGGRKERERNR